MKDGMTTGPATLPYLQPVVGLPRRGARRLLNVAWASSPCLKLRPSFLFGLLLFFSGDNFSIQAQEELLPPPKPGYEIQAAESYSFSMKLPPGTDCFVRIKLKGSGTEKNEQTPGSSGAVAPSDSAYAMKLERSFRKGITSSKEINPKGADQIFYIIGKMYAYDDPRQGINIVNDLEGHDNSCLAVYDFPELAWAVPRTRQPDPEVKEGRPPVRLYKIPSAGLTLEVDAASGYPLRYIEDGMVEWTYSYKVSSDPIVLPEKIKGAWLQLLNAGRRKI